MKLEAVLGDITQIDCDAIINAANNSLLGGGGVDGAIHQAAGPELLAACRALGGCATGEAKATKSYKLPARHVIHTVGPVWRGGGCGEAALLEKCYVSCFEVAWGLKIESLAFPSISTGAYRYPLEEAAQIAVRTIKKCLEDPRSGGIRRVAVVCHDPRTLGVYGRLIEGGNI